MTFLRYADYAAWSKCPGRPALEESEGGVPDPALTLTREERQALEARKAALEGGATSVEPLSTGIAYLINYRHDSSSGQAEHPAPADHPKFVGEYHLTFRKVDGEWKIATLRFDLAFLRRRTADRV